MSVVVTGASAFVGREVLDALADALFDVIAVSRRSPAHESGHVRWEQLDLMDAAAVTRLFSALKPTYLMHLAWCAGSPA